MDVNVRATVNAAQEIMAGIKQAVAEWAADGYLRVKAEVQKNLTGKVLHAKPSGRLAKSVDLNSRVFENGFSIGTNVGYGIAWELGFSRRAYTIRPAAGRPYASPEYEESILPFDDPRARLRFEIGGRAVFAKEVHIPAQEFPARSWLRSAFEKNREYLRKSMGKFLNRNLKPRMRKLVGRIELIYGRV